MTEYLSDKEQVELFKKWWREYGKSILFAVVVGLFIGFGWRYYHQRQATEVSRASLMYTQVQAFYAQNQSANAALLVNELKQHEQKTPYANLAALFAARDAVAKNNNDEALNQLQFVIKNSKMISIKQIARIRAARVLLAKQDPNGALAVLQTVDDATYQPLIDETKGDIAMAFHHPAEAFDLYQRAKNAWQAQGVSDPWLQMKMAQ